MKLKSFRLTNEKANHGKRQPIERDKIFGICTFYMELLARKYKQNLRHKKPQPNKEIKQLNLYMGWE